MMKSIFKEMWGEVAFKARYGLFFGLGCACTCVILYMTGCTMIEKLVQDIPQDSYVEELAEELIECYTGIEGLDLSPNSPEK